MEPLLRLRKIGAGKGVIGQRGLDLEPGVLKGVIGGVILFLKRRFPGIWALIWEGVATFPSNWVRERNGARDKKGLIRKEPEAF